MCERWWEEGRRLLKDSSKCLYPQPTVRQRSTRTAGPDVGSGAAPRLIGLIASTLFTGIRKSSINYQRNFATRVKNVSGVLIGGCIQ